MMNGLKNFADMLREVKMSKRLVDLVPGLGRKLESLKDYSGQDIVVHGVRVIKTRFGEALVLDITDEKGEKRAVVTSSKYIRSIFDGIEYPVVVKFTYTNENRWEVT